MKLFLDAPSDGPTNMARDLALQQDAEEGQANARVYSWFGRWVTLGRFQSAKEALLEYVPYVVRPTGGGAVLHGHDVTVAVAIPHDMHHGSRRSVRDVYKSLVAPLVEALNACGLPAKLAEETKFSGNGKRGGDCFAFSSPNDVVDPSTGLKVCGCALRITDRGALLQASIPRTTPRRLASELLKDGVDLPIGTWAEDRFREEFRLALSRTFGEVEARERMTLYERKLCERAQRRGPGDVISVVGYDALPKVRSGIEKAAREGNLSREIQLRLALVSWFMGEAEGRGFSLYNQDYHAQAVFEFDQIPFPEPSRGYGPYLYAPHAASAGRLDKAIAALRLGFENRPLNDLTLADAEQYKTRMALLVPFSAEVSPEAFSAQVSQLIEDIAQGAHFDPRSFITVKKQLLDELRANYDVSRGWLHGFVKRLEKVE